MALKNKLEEAMAPTTDERRSIAKERHYTPQQVAAIWNVSVDTVIRRFRNEPGVLEIGNNETLHKRRKKLMRIPESVLERIHESNRSK